MARIIAAAIALTFALLAPTAAQAHPRILSQSDGTVTVDWPNRLCGPPAATDDLFSVVIDDNGIPDDSTSTDTDATLIYAWRVIYRSDGSYEAWYDDDRCLGDTDADTNVELVAPSQRNLTRFAHASQVARQHQQVREARRRR